jgi:hypothetical protein
MRALCSSVVERLGATWGGLGWVLFGTYLLGWYLAPDPDAGAMIVVVAVVLLLLWWTVDVIDQEIAVWQIVLGIIMLVIGGLPYGGLLRIACWVICWTRLRE